MFLLKCNYKIWGVWVVNQEQCDSFFSWINLLKCFISYQICHSCPDCERPIDGGILAGEHTLTRMLSCPEVNCSAESITPIFNHEPIHYNQCWMIRLLNTGLNWAISSEMNQKPVTGKKCCESPEHRWNRQTDGGTLNKSFWGRGGFLFEIWGNKCHAAKGVKQMWCCKL